MRAYHFLPLDFGLDDLRRRRLKIARLSDLNDPFDLLGAALPNAQQRRYAEDTRARLDGKSGLLCFSKSWRNPVQWSHYAERHRGLCLGFDLPDEFATEIQYAARRPPLDFDELVTWKSERQLSEINALLFTKFAHWRYEQEVRFLIDISQHPDEGGLRFKPFTPGELDLREVIVGARCPLAFAEIADALAPEDESVRVLKARLAFKSFRVVRQQNRRLWPETIAHVRA